MRSWQYGLTSLLAVAVSSSAYAQLAPTNAQYAARPSDTGHAGTNDKGGYSAAIPFEFPEARGGLAVPLHVGYGARGFGAAGRGWHLPLSYVVRDDSWGGRRPNATAPTTGRELITVVLDGQAYPMVKSGSSWFARRDAQNLELRPDGSGWKLLDGSGREYLFPVRNLGTNRDLWLLTAITSSTGANRVELGYSMEPRTFDPDGEGGVPAYESYAIDLATIKYNTHPTTSGCFKNEITLDYNAPSATPLAVSFQEAMPLVRVRTLAGVRVAAREVCGGPSTLTTLRDYRFVYGTDLDTGQAASRLQEVYVLGRTGTPEATSGITLATYSYGAATDTVTGGRQLSFSAGVDISLPSEVPANNGIGHTDAPSTSVNNWQNFLDMTGDGRPDFVFKNSGTNQLRIAQNRPHATSGSSLTSMPTQLLSSAVYNNRPLASSATNFTRYGYNADNRDEVWRQVVDMNGDGRLDIVDASESATQWIVYLNKQGTNGTAVEWVRRPIATGVSVRRTAPGSPS